MDIIYLSFIHFQITRSVSNIAMRNRRVANTDVSCYGVFRILEPMYNYCDYTYFDGGKVSCDQPTPSALSSALPQSMSGDEVGYFDAGLIRFGSIVWENNVNSFVVDTTVGDLRGVGGTVAQFSPMGSTTKLVIDANNDEVSKVSLWLLCIFK